MRPQYYRQYSFECLQLANTTSDPGTKTVLVDMAKAWMKLAEQAKVNHCPTQTEKEFSQRWKAGQLCPRISQLEGTHSHIVF
jgi:hypothetical protein